MELEWLENMIRWLRIRHRLVESIVALMRSDCRQRVYGEGEMSEALARAVACHDDSRERMLLGRRSDFA